MTDPQPTTPPTPPTVPDPALDNPDIPEPTTNTPTERIASENDDDPTPAGQQVDA